MQRSSSTVRISLIVALGGFLLGFDSAVISGVTGPVRDTFGLDSGQQGWTASCLILGAMLGNALAGPLSNRWGRKTVLIGTAILFGVSALASGLATSYHMLVVARIIGGLGVGSAILIAPIYIAEIAPPEHRGRLVSFNQLNIVIGISAAFFANEAINRLVEGPEAWRWMLGIETLPAVMYLVGLFLVPRSPRWLVSKGRRDEGRAVFVNLGGEDYAAQAMVSIDQEIERSKNESKARLGDLFTRRMSWIMTIALSLAFFQQITGINAIFYYAATIFEKAGAGVESALRQGTLIGLVNLVFTLLAMWLIDRIGRKPLLLIGSAGMAAALFVTSSAFQGATYELTDQGLDDLHDKGQVEVAAALRPMAGQSFEDHKEFRTSLRQAVVAAELAPEVMTVFDETEGDVAKGALVINGLMVLFAIMLYIASFAISLGPVMWAMLSEIFPNSLRGLGISVAGFFNSLVSFTVVQVFPWELDNLGPATTFLIFGVFAALTFVFTLVLVPETKQKSLEELEAQLVRS